jgi:CDP-diglyceride synthetase
VTLRPSRFNRWVLPAIALAIAGGLLVGGYEMLVHPAPGETWLDSLGGVVAIALAVAALIVVAVVTSKAYIRVDDSTITFGPPLTASAARRNSFSRREVARIRATRSPMTRITLFLRSDGSTLTSTSGYFWGQDGLQKLADYLGVPFEW